MGFQLMPHKDPDARRAYMQAYREARRDKASAATAAWQRANRERSRKHSREWNRAYREQLRPGARAWRKANRERNLELDRVWRKANPCAVRAAKLRRRACGVVTAGDLLDVREMSDGVCSYCLQPCTALAVDHVLPVSRGGTNDLDNLVMACKSCNSAKGAKTPLEYLCGLPKLGVR